MYSKEEFTRFENWNTEIASLPDAHILQTMEWGSIKDQFGWQPSFFVWRDECDFIVGAALVLERIILIPGFGSGLRILYVPRGPLLDWVNHELRVKILQDLKGLARTRDAVFIKIDPDVCVGFGEPGIPGTTENKTGGEVVGELSSLGWIKSKEQIQFQNTVIIDLSPDEDQLLANMKQKTRYNVRLAERKGVSIRVGSDDDIDLLYQMFAETSVRDGFVIRDKNYYETVWSTFIQAKKAEPLIAEVRGEAVAGLINFYFSGRTWFLYGMSRDIHRKKMPNYLLQWKAICRAKAKESKYYDLWGAPDVFEKNDPMWGVYRFKNGLGGTVVRNIGAYDLPVRKVLYRLYTQTLPKILALMRRQGKERTRRFVT
ncbi:lipid II:glycine glycyltransferase FemX [Chloroflexota bacterium]